MSLTRIAVLGVSAAVLAVMIAGATTSTTRRTSPAPVVNTTTAEIKGAELAAEVARLRARLRPTVEPQFPARNLFQFGARRSPRVAAVLPSEPSGEPAPAT
jgi:hypothetical protein